MVIGYFQKTNEGLCLSQSIQMISIQIPSPGIYNIGSGQLTISEVNSNEFEKNSDPSIEYVSAGRIEWPLEVRSIRDGDHFQPLGMLGRTKKIQDFLVDLKMDLHEKKETLLLTSNHQIVWVMGLRLDERFKVQPGDQKILKLHVSLFFSQKKYLPPATERGP